jgi:hypothetical protein
MSLSFTAHIAGPQLIGSVACDNESDPPRPCAFGLFRPPRAVR